MARHRIQMTDSIRALGAQAAAVYAARQERRQHPEGEFDKAGRWYPSCTESGDDYTSLIRRPSRSWPYSYMKAARGRPHIIGLALYEPEFLGQQSIGLEADKAKAEGFAKSILKALRAQADEDDLIAARQRAADDAEFLEHALLAGIAA